MTGLLDVFARHHLLPLFRRKLGFIDGDLIAPGIGDAESGGLAIEPIGGHGIFGRGDAVELAPGEHFDSAGVIGLGPFFQKTDLAGAGRFVAHLGDDLVEGRSRRPGRRRWRRAVALALLAGGIRRRQTAIGAIEVIELRPSARRRQQSGDGKPKEKAAPHAVHHSRNRGMMLAVFGLIAGALSGCSSPPGTAESSGMNPLTWLKAIPAFDQTPPAIIVRRGGLSGELLTGPAPPLLPDDAIDASVGDALHPWLTPMERRPLAEASQRAVATITGNPVPWQSTDNLGVTTAAGAAVPVSDPFRSTRGRICRDVRQYVEKSAEPHQQLVTLCREDRGNDLTVWVVGQADQ